MSLPARLDTPGELMEKLVIGGDLSKLTPEERVRVYTAVCQSVGLNPLTQPFQFLFLQGKMTLYARKEATEQLREIHGVRITRLEPKTLTDQGEEFYEVVAYGVNAKGREDADLGVVSLAGLRGLDRANAKMKAVTKAKRRLTLSLCGLGVLDESEIDVPEGARVETQVLDVGEPDSPKLVNAASTAAPKPSEYGQRTGESGAPVAHVETRTLFPSPESDRTGLIQRARVAAARLDKKRVGDMKAQHLGSADADYKACDLSALVSLVTELEGVKL